VIPQVLIQDLLFTLPLVPDPDCALDHKQELTTQSVANVLALTQDQLCVLWHQRLCHMHSRRVATAYKYAEGVPKVPLASMLESCRVCMKLKPWKAAQHQTSSRHATHCNQGIAIDFGFVVQERKESLSLPQCHPESYNFKDSMAKRATV
jgi:hypothetical protein